MADDFTNSKLLKPFVYWGQDKFYIYLKVEIGEITTEPEIDLTEDYLTFQAQGLGVFGKSNYGFEINFYLSIDVQESKRKTTGRFVEFSLRKSGQREIWPRLTEAPQKMAWLKTDFDKFAFDSSSNSSSSSDSERDGSSRNRIKDIGKKNKMFPDEEDDDFMQKLASDFKEVEAEYPYDFKKAYLFIYYLFNWVGYCFILIAIAIRSLKDPSPESRKGTYMAVGGQMITCQVVCILEIFHGFLGWSTKSKPLMTFFQVFGRNFILLALIYGQEKMQEREVVCFLFTVWSLSGAIRCPYHILHAIGRNWSLVTWLHYTAWVVLLPLSFIFEGLVLIMSFPLFEESKKWSLEISDPVEFSFRFDYLLIFYMVVTLPFMYVLMQQLYKERKQKLYSGGESGKKNKFKQLKKKPRIGISGKSTEQGDQGELSPAKIKKEI